MDPLVSIIIPVYNGSDYLDRAIRSALNQIYPNNEIIVVNDGSDDNGRTREVALGFGDRIFYYEKENGGVASAFNYGIRMMKGDYFSWLSHDDEYYPEKTQIQIDTIMKQGVKNSISFSNTDYIDENSDIISSDKISRIKNVRPSIIQLQMITKRPLINGNTVMIPVSCLEKVGMFNESLKTSQDYEMWFRLAKYFPFHYTNEALVRTRIHKARGSKNIETFLDESCKTKIKMLNSINEEGLLNLSGEKNIKRFYLKLLIKYIKNGNEKAGWPTAYVISKVFPHNTLLRKLTSGLCNLKATRRIVLFFIGHIDFISEKC